MKTSTVITLIAISSLLFLIRADSIAVSSNQNDMPAFELMDLTELLKSLNVTYQDLAMNLSTLDSLNNLPSPSQIDQNQPNNSPSQTKSATTKTTTDAVIPSQNTSQDSKTVSTPKTASSTSNPSSSTPQKIIDPAAKPSTSPVPDPRPTKNIQPASTTSTSSSASTTTSSSSSSSNSPTFGPGPNNKSLPPVIDLTKMTVDYVAPASKPTNSSPASNPSTKTTTTAATQTAPQDNTAPSTKSASTPAVKTNSNNIVNNLNSNSPTQPSSNTQSNPTVSPSTAATKTQTASVSTQTNIQPTSSTPKTTQTTKSAPATQPTDKNSVYLAPISAQAKPASDPIKSNFQNQQSNQPQSSSNTPASDDSAIYNITASYKAFSPYFIITKNDPYLPQLRTYLLNNYGNYLSQGQIIAGFRLYNKNGDNSLDYQLLYSTFYGTFTTILTYWPDTNRIMLKTLSILNFYIMEIDYSNCQTQDLVQQNCKVCNDGYYNYKGRCRCIEPNCLTYLTDQCGACSAGKKLVNGQCQ